MSRHGSRHLAFGRLRRWLWNEHGISTSLYLSTELSWSLHICMVVSDLTLLSTTHHYRWTSHTIGGHSQLASVSRPHGAPIKHYEDGPKTDLSACNLVRCVRGDLQQTFRQAIMVSALRRTSNKCESKRQSRTTTVVEYLFSLPFYTCLPSTSEDIPFSEVISWDIAMTVSFSYRFRLSWTSK